MPEQSFMIGSSSGNSIRLEPQEIRGEGAPACPRLVIPVKMSLNPSIKGEGSVQPFEIIQLSGSLLMSKPPLKIGDLKSYSQPYKVRYPNVSATYAMEIPLDFYRIEWIEENRNGDLPLKLDLNFLIALYERFPLPKERDEVEAITKDVITEFETSWQQMEFTIPQSHWVEKILPGLGYGKVKLIEVPIPEKIVPDTFEKALQELEQAQGYFIEGDYDKVVAHCRNAIQLIPEVLPLSFAEGESQTYPSKVKKFLEQHLADVLSNSKRDWLENILRASWTLGSKAHHPSVLDQFNRNDANSIMLVTTAMLAYVGKLLASKETR